MPDSHLIAEALTADEARAVAGMFLQTVEQFDEHGDMNRMLRGVLQSTRVAQRLAAAADGCTGMGAVEAAQQQVAA